LDRTTYSICQYRTSPAFPDLSRLSRPACLAAEVKSDSFSEIDQFEIGNDDVNMIRVAADYGGSPTLVDVRINSVRVVADELGTPAPLAPTRHGGRSGSDLGSYWRPSACTVSCGGGGERPRGRSVAWPVCYVVVSVSAG
jgi:hypothetical protein